MVKMLKMYGILWGNRFLKNWDNLLVFAKYNLYMLTGFEKYINPDYVNITKNQCIEIAFNYWNK